MIEASADELKEGTRVRPFDSKPQNQDILAHLRMCPDKGLTVSECLYLGMGSELRKRLSELRRDGYVFFEFKEPNSSGRGTHKRWFLRYEPVRTDVVILRGREVVAV